MILMFIDQSEILEADADLIATNAIETFEKYSFFLSFFFEIISKYIIIIKFKTMFLTSNLFLFLIEMVHCWLLHLGVIQSLLQLQLNG